MSRFSTLLRLIPQAMFVLPSAACDIAVEPIYSVDASDADPTDAGPVALTSRVLVADGAGLIAFDFVGQAAPYGTAVRWDGVSAAVVDSNVLFLARPGSNAIAIYDDAGRLDPERSPTRELNDGETGGAFGSIEEMRVDANGTLWIHLGEGEVRAFVGATVRLPDGSYSAAVFRDGRLDGFAYEPEADRLFAGPGDAGQVLVWEEALTRESLGPSSFALAGDCVVTAMAIADRLYAACADRRIAVWTAPADLMRGASPDVTLHSAGGVRDLRVDRGVLIATGASGVDVWTSAATADGSPDTHLDIPGTRSLQDEAGTLFVLNTTDVQVVRNAVTAPEVMGAVRSERSPLDIARH